MTSAPVSRRTLLATVSAALGAVISVASRPARAAPQAIEMQLGWIGGGNQLGEAAAIQLGYFAEEGLDLTIIPGGPNNDGVAGVASGRSAVGQVSSSPSLMLAVSQDLPIRCFAVSAQKHPYAFFSLAKNPVHTPADLRGKKVGIQATGVVLLRALLAKNGMSLSDVQVVTIGSDMTAAHDRSGGCCDRLGYQHHGAESAWSGPGDAAAVGCRRAPLRQSVLCDPRHAGRPRRHAGPLPARQRPRLGVRLCQPRQGSRTAGQAISQSGRRRRTRRRRRHAGLHFDEHTKAGGYGTMDPAVWQDQIDLYASLGQFTKRTPKLDEVMTLAILNATADTRPKIG